MKLNLIFFYNKKLPTLFNKIFYLNKFKFGNVFCIFFYKFSKSFLNFKFKKLLETKLINNFYIANSSKFFFLTVNQFFKNFKILKYFLFNLYIKKKIKKNFIFYEKNKFKTILFKSLKNFIKLYKLTIKNFNFNDNLLNSKNKNLLIIFNKKNKNKINKANKLKEINLFNYKNTILHLNHSNILKKITNISVIIFFNLKKFFFKKNLFSLKKKIPLFFFIKNLILLNDKINIFNWKYNKLNNVYILKNFSFLGFNDKTNYVNNRFSNYYPVIILNKKINYLHNNHFKKNTNIIYLNLTNRLIISFFELNFKKNFYLKITNNYFNKIKNPYFNKLVNNYKNYQPEFFKKFLILDFLEIIWYSFLLKDLDMISQWISYFMESLNFRNHKKFLNFFQNFLTKYSNVFIRILKVKGFLFDIRGKVGVTGSSKKRHFCFKFGSLNKSNKMVKININQNLVRTYSGVLGLTYIISF